MKLELSDEALEYGQASLRAIESAGGDRLVQIAEEEPERWEGLVAPVLKELGADELDPGADADELEAAAALCRSAGYWVVPYPLAGRLCRPRELDAAGLVVVADPPRACVPDRRIRGLGGGWPRRTPELGSGAPTQRAGASVRFRGRARTSSH